MLIPFHTSSFRRYLRENKLYIYASFYSEHTITIIHFCSGIRVVCNGRSPAFYYIFIVTFSLSTYVQLFVVSTFMSAHTASAPQKLQRYIALQPSHTCQHDAFILGSGSRLTPKNKEKLRERLEGHVRGMLLQTTLQ